MFIRIWRFRAAPGKLEAFRAAYGPAGSWSVLFRRAPGFLGTELLSSSTEPDAFLTLDRWESAGAWKAFLAGWQEAYKALDRECEALTVEEREIGSFDSWVG